MSTQDAVHSTPAGVPRPPELTPPEALLWDVLTQVMTLLLPAVDSQLQRQAGITYFEYRCLGSLAKAPERRLRMSELAEQTRGSLSRLSHVSKRLQRQGLITRSPDPHDRRTTIAALTQSGLGTWLLAQPGHVALSRALVLDALAPEDQVRLTQLLSSLLPRVTRHATQ